MFDSQCRINFLSILLLVCLISGIGMAEVRKHRLYEADNPKAVDPAQWKSVAGGLHGGFGTVDLRVNHTLSKTWTLRGHLRNMLDKDYETIRTYNTAGREFFVTLAYQP